MGKNNTMKIAMKLFAEFGFKQFTTLDVKKYQLKITEDDIKHIKMFNCLKRIGGFKDEFRTDKGRNETLKFTKEPKIDLSLFNN